MAETVKVIIDPGHGGVEPGATYLGRQEKNDTLNLALAVGNILAQHGIDVVYTRVTDVYNTPYEKAQIANRSGADYFVSIHRNAMPVPGSASGAETLVYQDSGVPALMAQNINSALASVGFDNLGVIERPGLVVLRRTEMPAVLVEAGFIDNDADNQLFDQRFGAMAQAIADGILKTIEEEQKNCPEYYQVQTGAFQNLQAAQRQLDLLRSQGYPSFIVNSGGLHKVRTGAFLSLDNAAHMEQELKNSGYTTLIVRESDVYCLQNQ